MARAGVMSPEIYARLVNVGLVPPLGTTLLDGDVNAQRFLKNGVSIDSSAAYPNIAYINRANTFTATPQTAPTFNGSTALQYGGVDINTNTALSNVPYLNKANVFSSGTQTVPTLNAVTAIQLNGTSIGVNTAYANIVYIDRSNTFTGTTQTAPNFNATTALQVGGANINTASTLSNVGYLSANQTFAGNNVFSGDVTFSGQDRLVIYRSSAHASTTSGATPVIDFNAKDTVDVGGLAISSDTVTILVAGTYLLSAQISYPSNATGDRGAFVQLNSATKNYAVIRACSGAIETVVATPAKPVACAVNDVIRLLGYQTSGGGLIPANGIGSTWLSIARLY